CVPQATTLCRWATRALTLTADRRTRRWRRVPHLRCRVSRARRTFAKRASRYSHTFACRGIREASRRTRQVEVLCVWSLRLQVSRVRDRATRRTSSRLTFVRCRLPVDEPPVHLRYPHRRPHPEGV